MIYKYKINRFSWYKSPITGKYITKNRRPRVEREDVVEIVNHLKLKTVVRIRQNKKPYIIVALTSLDEYRKLVGAMPNTYKPYHERNLAKYK